MVVVGGAWRAPCAARGRHNGGELGGGRAPGGRLGQRHGAHGGATELLGDRTELDVVRGGDGDERAEDGHGAEGGHEQHALAELDHGLLILAAANLCGGK